MKIAVLTQPLHTNYGGILQAYALQTFLEDQGHEVIVVNRDYNFKLSPKLLLLRLGSVAKCIMRSVILNQKEYCVMNPFSPFYHTKWTGYDVLPFVKKYIKQSKEIRSSQALRKYFKKYKFDCYIVGSDQVWRPCYSPCITDFFLKELPAGNKSLKVAYAASFGTDKWEFTDTETNECSALAKLFDAVSVREASGIKLCKEYLGVPSQHILDPTMLLDKNKYIRIIEEENVQKTEGNVFCYILDANDELNRVVASLIKDGYKPNYASLNIEVIKDNPHSYQMSVQKWLRSFYDAEFVITDSFHGCVFSIIFNKPFVCFGNKSRGNARFESLLRMFGLEDRWVDNMQDYTVLHNEIDWKYVNRVLEEKQRKSVNFLREALKD